MKKDSEFEIIRKLFPENSKRDKILWDLLNFIDDRMIPPHISNNFSNPRDLNIIKSSLEENYFRNKDYLQSTLGQKDLSNHITGRLWNFRRVTIPWLDSIKRLNGANILEIGCGTGSSTVALAEQGCHVNSIDIDDNSLIVARDRCSAYSLNATFEKANATDAHKIFIDKRFDFIIFWASLEHMTHEERLASIKSTWEMLPTDGLLGITETPNRLWYWDGHTANLPFYHWLPDDLAYKYARFSPNACFNNLYINGDNIQYFLRKGRGVSFHEFELALGQQLNVVSSLNLRRRNFLWWLRWRLSMEYTYESMISKLYPKVHKGFFQPYLDILIKK